MRSHLVIATTSLLALLLASGCGTGGGPAAAGGEATGTGGEATPPSTAAAEEEPVRIRLTIGDQEATGTLDENTAARDLVSLLPLTVSMGDLRPREAGPVAPGADR